MKKANNSGRNAQITMVCVKRQISYYLNVTALPVFFLIALTLNVKRLMIQAWYWTLSETGEAYRSNRRHHDLE